MYNKKQRYYLMNNSMTIIKTILDKYKQQVLSNKLIDTLKTEVFSYLDKLNNENKNLINNKYLQMIKNDPLTFQINKGYISDIIVHIKFEVLFMIEEYNEF